MEKHKFDDLMKWAVGDEWKRLTLKETYALFNKRHPSFHVSQLYKPRTNKLSKTKEIKEDEKAIEKPIVLPASRWSKFMCLFRRAK